MEAGDKASPEHESYERPHESHGAAAGQPQDQHAQPNQPPPLPDATADPNKNTRLPVPHATPPEPPTAPESFHAHATGNQSDSGNFHAIATQSDSGSAPDTDSSGGGTGTNQGLAIGGASQSHPGLFLSAQELHQNIRGSMMGGQPFIDSSEESSVEQTTPLFPLGQSPQISAPPSSDTSTFVSTSGDGDNDPSHELKPRSTFPTTPTPSGKSRVEQKLAAAKMLTGSTESDRSDSYIGARLGMGTYAQLTPEQEARNTPENSQSQSQVTGYAGSTASGGQLQWQAGAQQAGAGGELATAALQLAGAHSDAPADSEPSAGHGVASHATHVAPSQGQPQGEQAHISRCSCCDIL